MPPADCINCRTCRAPFILTLTSRKTTSTALALSAFNLDNSATRFIHVQPQQYSATSFISMLSSAFKVNVPPSSMHIDPQIPHCSFLKQPFCSLPFQMAALNFNRILLMLEDPGSIPWETLQSQDGLNVGDIHFCPTR